MVGRWADFAVEQPAEQALAVGGTIRRDDVNELVIEQIAHPFARRERLVRETERGDLDGHEIARDCLGGRVSEIGEVGQQDRDFFRRCEVEELPVERQRVLERPADVWREERLRRIEIEKVEVGGLRRCELRPHGRRRGGQSRRRRRRQRKEPGTEVSTRKGCCIFCSTPSRIQNRRGRLAGRERHRGVGACEECLTGEGALECGAGERPLECLARERAL